MKQVFCPLHGIPLERIAPNTWQCPRPGHPPINEFESQTGALLALHIEQERKRTTAQLTDPTPTHELPHYPLPDVIDRAGETWLTHVPERRRIGIWHRVKHWMKRG